MRTSVSRTVGVCLASLAAVGGACTTRVAGPVEVRDPVTVYVADYGRHATLLLPREHGDLAEYGYGHWKWFALGENWLAKGPPVLLVPGQGTLARRELDPITPAGPSPAQLGAKTIQGVEVDRSAAADLLQALDARFESAGGPPVHNPDYGLDFVPDPAPYWILNNCNTQLGRWLARLGCEVRGPAMTSDFRLEAPAGRRE